MRPALLVICYALALAWVAPLPSPARWLCHGLALTALTLAIAAASALVPLLAVTGV